jgi:hypothetical protein
MPADDKIIVNVRLLPEEPPTREHPHLTRFQLGTKRDATREKLAFECNPGDTVAKLKQMIEGAAARRVPSPRGGGERRDESPARLAPARAISPRLPRTPRRLPPEEEAEVTAFVSSPRPSAPQTTAAKRPRF